MEQGGGAVVGGGVNRAGPGNCLSLEPLPPRLDLGPWLLLSSRSAPHHQVLGLAVQTTLWRRVQGGAEVMDGAVGDVTICQLVTHAGTGCGGGAFQHPSALTGLPGFRQDPRPRRGQGPD